MNLVLFEPDEIGRPLPTADPRVRHLLEVLHRRPGEEFDAGLTTGVQGRARLESNRDAAVTVSFRAGPPLPPRVPAVLLVGLPRPQTARDILRDATTLGATTIHFVQTGRADANYGGSKLWSTGEWRRHVLAGAMQAFDPRLPTVTWHLRLQNALNDPALPGARYVLDPYTISQTWPCGPGDAGVALAIGPERGWDEADRVELQRAGFHALQLGTRILRTETAVVAALALLLIDRQRGGTTPPSVDARPSPTV